MGIPPPYLDRLHTQSIVDEKWGSVVIVKAQVSPAVKAGAIINTRQLFIVTTNQMRSIPIPYYFRKITRPVLSTGYYSSYHWNIFHDFGLRQIPKGLRTNPFN